jgi:hypothetical protein
MIKSPSWISTNFLAMTNPSPTPCCS